MSKLTIRLDKVQTTQEGLPNGVDINQVSQLANSQFQSQESKFATNAIAIVNHSREIAIQGVQMHAQYTGNAEMANNLNMGLRVVGDLTTIAAGFVAGGVVGGGIAIAAIGINLGMEAARNNLMIRMREREIAFDSELMGETFIDGGRSGF